MKKLSKIDESIWSDIHKRSNGEQVRKEDIAKSLKIDGVEYKFTTDFWQMGEEFNEENSDEWTCFAFNKMPNGSTTISGDTEEAGIFGYDKWDIGDWEYDVYVLRDYFEKTIQELVQDIIEHGNIHSTGIAEIEKILVDYSFRLYENHMSDFAHYWIYELHGSDWSDDIVIMVHTVVDDVPDEVKEEFEGYDITEAHQIVFPMIDNWYDKLDAVLTFAYEKLGYTKSKEYELDPYSSPGNTMGICFVKMEKTSEEYDEDNEYRDY